MKKKIIIVVPTIRENSISRFIDEWSNEFFNSKKFNVTLMIIEDNPKKTFSINNKKNKIIHYSWEEIDTKLSRLFDIELNVFYESMHLSNWVEQKLN